MELATKYEALSSSLHQAYEEQLELAMQLQANILEAESLGRDSSFLRLQLNRRLQTANNIKQRMK